MNKEVYETNIDIVWQKWRNNNNFIVKDNKNDSKKCLILCSDNGLFHPFTEQSFVEKIVESDKYQFLRITDENIFKKKFARIIYIRDIWRSWYLLGLNEQIDSIDKIIDKMRELTEGYEIIVAGVSSGGYMSTILGCKLNAKTVFSFSGQFCLKVWLKSRMFPRFVNDPERSKYFDIVSLVQESDVNIYYFYPFYNKLDGLQVAYISQFKDMDNLHIMSFNHGKHGRVITPHTFKYLFCMDNSKLNKIFDSYKGKKVSRYLFTIRVGGIKGFFDCIKGLLHRMRRIKQKG